MRARRIVALSEAHGTSAVTHGNAISDQGISPSGTATQLPRAVQNLTLESIAATGELTKSDGASMHKWDYEIVGRYDAQMAVGDTWTNGGTIYRITAIKPFNQYEQRGVVSAIGKDPNYGI